MTDEELLDRIQKSELTINKDTLEVRFYHRSHRKFITKKVIFNHDGRAKFMFGPRKSRRSVYRNRLVWMYFPPRMIPEGFIIDHIDEDPTNDHPNNLQLMRNQESHLQGNIKQSDRILYELCHYFEFCSFMGREPRIRDAA